MKLPEESDSLVNTGDVSWKQVLFWSVFVLIVTVGFWMVKDLSHRCDEGSHGPQIGKFLHGDFSSTGYVATFLGYHVVIAGIMKLLGMESMDAARLISLSFASMVPLIAYCIASDIKKKTALIKTALLVSLPMIFPLMFFLYTDLWSLGILLLMLWLSFAGKHKSAAVVAVLAVLTRQTNLIWVFYAVCLIAFKAHRNKWPPLSWKSLMALFRLLWPYGFVFLGFGCFFIYNGGIAVGDQANQAEALNLTNVSFLLVTLGLLFWPITVAEAFRYKPKRKELLMWVGTWLAVVVFAWINRYSAHTYNHPDMDFYVHNQLLYFWADHFMGRILALTGLFSAVVLLFRSRLSMNPYGLFWIVSLLAIGLMPLVEFRYQIPILALFLILRDFSDTHMAKWNVFWLAGLSLILFFLTVQDLAFL